MSTRILCLCCAPVLLIATAQAEPREIFPHVRIDAEARIVEIDATVPIVLDDPEAPTVFLELLVCTPDTREHETLLVTRARPSHVHAALLLLGLEPGAPGVWHWKNNTLSSTPPTGPELDISFVYTDAAGTTRADHPSAWIKNIETNDPFPTGNWLFSGSRFVQHNDAEFYDADGTGVLMGLTAFSSEVLAWPEMLSPEADTDEPLWIANPETVPPLDTKVIIRITPESDSNK